MQLTPFTFTNILPFQPDQAPKNADSGSVAEETEAQEGAADGGGGGAEGGTITVDDYETPVRQKRQAATR